MKIIGERLYWLCRSRIDETGHICSEDNYNCEAEFYSNEKGTQFIMVININAEICYHYGCSIYEFNSLDELFEYLKIHEDKCYKDFDKLISDIKLGFDCRFI